MHDAHTLDTNDFVELFARHQRTIYAYVRTLTGRPQDADDVFQDVTLVLWKKRGEFAVGTSFLAWACRVAFFEVLAFAKRRQRGGLVCFDETLLADLAVHAAERAHVASERLTALRECMDRLPDRSRELIERRYAPGGNVKRLADEIGRTANSLSVTLHNIRRSLLECIERKTAGGEP